MSVCLARLTAPFRRAASRHHSRRHFVWAALPRITCLFSNTVKDWSRLRSASKGRWACVLCVVPVVMQHDMKESADTRVINGSVIKDAYATGDVNIDEVIAESDALLQEHKYEEEFNLLSKFSHVDNDELLWRLARVYCVWAKVQGERGHDHRRKELMEEGFIFAKRALELNNKSPRCHSWYATMMHFTSEYRGLRTHYLNAFTIKEHYETAVSLDPADAISLHSLGYWHFSFAHLPWYQKKLLAVLFRTPPSTTFEQALEYFYKAEEVAPEFFNMNLVMAGRAHWHLGQHQEALDLFKRASHVTPRSPDERLAYAKAHEMLKKMAPEKHHR
ncbi:regulator of microtubule dynamics protein 1-like isoform X1 [Pomacea canaliculata]|uniref:regulator of microtubule dynamics protein 1-like isoform X1 n=1 Tax=Pomacea canaliculata TaxID=400727 RepID=UPI000D735CD6|nr:regulator of microtubule dynamics protein 1-like isoform X1 [Pomacea canaliculata]